METYFFKMILLSAIFILLYYVFLEKEKNHHFKRFFLLLSVLFSLLVPLLSITYGIEVVEKSAPFFNQEIYILPNIKAEKPSFLTLENIFLGIYLLGFIALFLKFSWGIYKLFKEMKSSSKIKKDNYYIVLKENKITPYSFWNYVFLYREDFLENKIDVKILLHEEAHIAQKHSIDILFIELLLCVFWFNPSFYLYKKAMITNHEFLADDTVLQQYQDIENYQKLILRELISEKILFTHPFNLHNTKKRIIMMTTKLTKIAKLKSYLTLLVSALLFFTFVEKVPAKLETKSIIKKKTSSDKKIKTWNNEISLLKKDNIKPNQNKQKTVENYLKNYSKKIEKILTERKLKNQLQSLQHLILAAPEFPEGDDKLRQKILENFDLENLPKTIGILKTILNLSVSKNGDIEKVTAEGENETFNKEAIKSFKLGNGNTKWKPGKFNGNPSSTMRTFPIIMDFK